MKIDDVELSARQLRHFDHLRLLAVSAGASEEESVLVAEDAWRVLYRKEGDSWTKRTVARTSRGFSFAQRPDDTKSESLLTFAGSEAYDAALSALRGDGVVFLTTRLALGVEGSAVRLSAWGYSGGKLSVVALPGLDSTDAAAFEDVIRRVWRGWPRPLKDSMHLRVDSAIRALDARGRGAPCSGGV